MEYLILIVYIALFTFILVTGWVYFTKAGPRREYNVDLTDKIVIITGSSAGIGKETAKKLAHHGATIIFACRDKLKTLPIMDDIRNKTKNDNLHFIQLELSNYDSPREFVETFKQQFNKVDILINNAGIAYNASSFNKQGHNSIIATNYFGHFLLTYLLLPYFTDRSRIINVSSLAHIGIKSKVDLQKVIYEQNSFKMYAISKYANILFTQSLQKRFEEQNRNIKVVSLNPGMVRTEIITSKNTGRLGVIANFLIHTIGYIYTLSEEQGAWTTIYTAFQPYDELVPGGYYNNNKLSKASKYARSGAQEEELWLLSIKELGL
ncbi:hypothetical protein pb186bvf_013264 [Paramecium bursaria]